MKNIAISIGDINGIGLEIALKAHEKIKTICNPIYCVDKNIAMQGAKLLGVNVPLDFTCKAINEDVVLQPSKATKESGNYSYKSFVQAILLCQNKICDAVVTLPINKEAWMMAGLRYKGHTDMLRDYFKSDAIMMLGCQKLYVALFTEHIPLREVSSLVTVKKLVPFLLNLYKSVQGKKIAVLGLNPHAGDNGAIGCEEIYILEAIKRVNKKLKKEIFFGPVVPDVAFAPYFRKNINYICAMYHDQGLAPLKALYFDESINISLNLPIIRTSVDHGTAFDIAYQNKAKTLSYINAVKAAISFSKKAN